MPTLARRASPAPARRHARASAGLSARASRATPARLRRARHRSRHLRAIFAPLRRVRARRWPGYC
ncbi:hypothetical protein WS62_06570 [Burkholderia sp. ABCPW 14]|nr:hypothetical protein WS62_06570 [Burkholderia sp. ABCPW 14]